MGYDRQLFLKGKQIDVAANSAVVEWSFPYETRFVGVRVFIEGAWLWGDKATFTLHHPTTDNEVGRFGEDCYFTSNIKEIEVKTHQEGSLVPANLKYRMSATFVDSNGRKAAIWLIIRK